MLKNYNASDLADYKSRNRQRPSGLAELMYEENARALQGAMGPLTESEAGMLSRAKEQRFFPDSLLLKTHPAEMTNEMLEAARIRINEDPKFAELYRNSTDYVSNPLQQLMVNQPQQDYRLRAMEAIRQASPTGQRLGF